MNTDTTDNDATEEHSSDDEIKESPAKRMVLEDRPRVTDTLAGTRNENYDGVERGAYPEGLDPGEFVGTLRRFVGKHIQYLQVVGDLDGHAVYRMLNEGGPEHKLHARPWDRFIEETARVNPDAPGTPDDDPARTVVRTDFDTMRRRRETEIETGCTCLENEACDDCCGETEASA